MASHFYLLLVSGSHHSTFCLHEHDCSGHLIKVESYSICLLVLFYQNNAKDQHCFTQTDVFDVHPYCSPFQNIILKGSVCSTIYAYLHFRYTLFPHSSVGGNLGGFHLLTVVNHGAAGNVGMLGPDPALLSVVLDIH